MLRDVHTVCCMYIGVQVQITARKQYVQVLYLFRVLELRTLLYYSLAYTKEVLCTFFINCESDAYTVVVTWLIQTAQFLDGVVSSFVVIWNHRNDHIGFFLSHRPSMLDTFQICTHSLVTQWNTKIDTMHILLTVLY